MVNRGGALVVDRYSPDEPHKTALLSESDIIALRLLRDQLPKPWDGIYVGGGSPRFPDREKMLLKETLESILAQCERQENFKR